MTLRIVTSNMAIRIASKYAGDYMPAKACGLSPQDRAELIDAIKRFKQSHKDFTVIEMSSSDGEEFTLKL